MSDRVSDLVFRDLWADDAPPVRAADQEWQAFIREQLDKLRPAASPPRVVPAGRDGDASTAE
jgi:hypothetical protein